MPNNNRFSRCHPRCHGSAQPMPNSRMSGSDPEHHRAAGDYIRSSFCRSWSVFVLSPDCQRRDRRAKRRGQEETRHGRIRAGSTHVATGTAKNAPRPKGPINPSLRTLRPAQRSLRLVWRTFQQQRCPDSHPTMTYRSGQSRIACLARRPPNNRSPQYRPNKRVRRITITQQSPKPVLPHDRQQTQCRTNRTFRTTLRVRHRIQIAREHRLRNTSPVPGSP
jgi:hypothetical protein